jgi:pyridoxal phosphate enzyme (YggS family)
MTSIPENLKTLQTRMAVAADKAGRNPDDVRLMAVTKGVEADRIAEAIQAGQRLFGENYVQEAKGKWPALRDAYPHADIELHLIGALQSNKAGDAVQFFDAIDVLDRVSLADELAKAMQKYRTLVPLSVEVNIGSEAQKHGCALGDLSGLLEKAEALSLNVQGLMAIPPAGQDPAPHFKALATLAKQYQLPELSMGMSQDFETAIACGATVIRLGTALFGPRQ